MPLTLADRVRDTTTTTGTGTVTLSGTAPTGYQNFSVIGNGNTTYYTINAGSQWEVGIGTYSSTGPTLARNTVLESSNGNALVDFAAGVKDVFVTYPADKSVNYDESNNVGIGTASPGAKLEVTGNTNANFIASIFRNTNAGSSAATSVRFGNDVSALASSIRVNANANSSNPNALRISNNISGDSSNIILATNGDTERMRITSAGLVQINTTSGGGWLNVNSSSGAPTLLLTNSANSNPFIQFANGSIIQGIGESSLENLRFRAGGTTGTLLFDTNATERMRITAAGDVGIGTASPGTRLAINDPGTGLGFTNAASGNFNLGLLAGTGSADAYVFQRANAPLIVGTNNTERMRITATGDVGIGTSDTNSWRLNIQSGSTSKLRFVNTVGNGNTIDFVDQSWQSQIIGSVGNLLFNAGGTTERMRIVSDGNVGIGTSSVSAVFGTTVKVYSAGSGGTLEVGGATVNARFYGSEGFGLGGIGTSTNHPFTFISNNTERMRITAAGDVGIGTSAPSTRMSLGSTIGRKLSVFDGGGVNSGLGVDMSGSGFELSFFSGYNGGNGQFTFGGFNTATNTYTERMRIDTSGNVGIGTSSPTFYSGYTTLELDSAANGGILSIKKAGNVVGYINGASGMLLLAQLNDLKLTTTGSTTIQFSTNATERMRITAAGDVGIGTALPQARLDVNSGASAAAAVFNSTSNTYLQLQNSGTNGLYLQSAASAAYLINQLNTPFLFGTNNTERMRLSGSGNLGVGTTATNVKFTVGGAAGNPTLNAASGIAEFRLDVTTMLAIGGYSSGSFALWLQGKQDNAGYTTTPWPISLNPAGGNVGVGTASPPSQLSVSFNPPVSIPALGSGVGGVSIGPATAYGMLVGTISDGNGYIQQQRFDGSTTVYNLLLQPSGGNVGIGTSNPLGRLAVASATGNVGFNTGTSSSPERGNLWYDTDGTGWLFNIGKRQSGTFTSQITILDAGSVGIACTPLVGTRFQTSIGTDRRFSVFLNGSDSVFGFLTDAGNWTDTFLNGNPLRFGISGTERMRLDASGNLLVGTTTAFARLAVNGSAYVAAGNDLQVGNVNNTNAASINSDSTDTSAALVFKTASAGLARTERMRITSGGLVQINTTSGSGHLNVNGTTGAPAIFLSDSSGNPYLQFANGSFIQGISGGILRLRTTNASAIVLDTNSAERVRITAAGDVGIGTASPTRLLSVAGTANAYMDFSASSFRRYTIGSESRGFILYDDTGSAYRMVVDASGNVGIGTDSPSERLNVSGNILATGNITAFSDIRLKDNVEQIGGALERVAAIRGVTYTRNDLEDKERRYAGVIAQELEQVLPEAVSQSGDMKAVDYNATIGLLIEAIKELTARVAQLEGTKP